MGCFGACLSSVSGVCIAGNGRVLFRSISFVWYPQENDHLVCCAYHGVMTPLTLWLALSNPISDCGCFGDAVTLTNWETFGKNVLLLIAAVSVFKWGNRITPLVTKRFDWLVAMYTFLYISGMTLYCYRELPVFDFRPYHIGADIRKGMEIPEGEKPTVYETRFILQKMEWRKSLH